MYNVFLKTIKEVGDRPVKGNQICCQLVRSYGTCDTDETGTTMLQTRWFTVRMVLFYNAVTHHITLILP